MTALKETLNWEAVETPLYDANGNQIQGWKQIKNSESGETLNIAKSSYTVAPNGQLVEMAESVADFANFDLQGYETFDGGQKVMAYLKSKENSLIAGVESCNYLVIGNSHDGQGAYFTALTNHIYRCKNMFSSYSKQNRIFHHSGIIDRIKQAEETINLFYDHKDGVFKQADQMSQKKLSAKQLNYHRKAFAFECLQIDPKKEMGTRAQNRFNDFQESIETELTDLGNNAWALFNGATRFSTHSMKEAKSAFGQLFNSPRRLNDRAWKYCSKIK